MSNGNETISGLFLKFSIVRPRKGSERASESRHTSQKSSSQKEASVIAIPRVQQDMSNESMLHHEQNTRQFT